MALRFADPQTGELETLKLGVVKFFGAHTAVGIKEHLESRFQEFGLTNSDIASIATDSGANVRKCCIDLAKEKGIDWVPCINHGLHNSSRYAFGLVDEDIEVNEEEDPIFDNGCDEFQLDEEPDEEGAPASA